MRSKDIKIGERYVFSFNRGYNTFDICKVTGPCHRVNGKRYWPVVFYPDAGYAARYIEQGSHGFLEPRHIVASLEDALALEDQERCQAEAMEQASLARRRDDVAQVRALLASHGYQPPALSDAILDEYITAPYRVDMRHTTLITVIASVQRGRVALDDDFLE